VKGAFDATWWPGMLKEQKACGCPKNLYELTKSYFTQRTATLSSKNIRLERGISKDIPHGSRCGSGLWNIEYNFLLNLNYTTQTKGVAFEDDLTLVYKGRISKSGKKNYSNVELCKIILWLKNNKVITFNEEKFKAMLVSRRKRKEQREIKIYLNNKQLEQVIRIKYLVIIIDHKFRFQEHIYATERCTKRIYS
jgi:hypothetical protein